ncbi:MAG TPA: glycosyltransferase family 2 protein [Candidatus Micrarchaeia archaeon]|nr:glycosyltransferase family 2 protein [Candidatus Micrarchaeia archaeon]
MGPVTPLSGSIGVVVPTRNSARTLARCLASLRGQTRPCPVVVVDNYSGDETQAIARRLADRLVVAGPERSRQRNLGAAALPTTIVGFIDSDMVVPPTMIEEVGIAMAGGAGAAIIPERSVGEGYWARVRALERSACVGHRGVEAARFFRREVLDAVGGWDEDLSIGEDRDLTLRAGRVTAFVRTQSLIDHDEGRLRFLDDVRKRSGYALGVEPFVRKHGWRALAEAIDRPYLRRPWRVAASHPGLAVGLVALKAGEAAAVAWGVARGRGPGWRPRAGERR